MKSITIVGKILSFTHTVLMALTCTMFAGFFSIVYLVSVPESRVLSFLDSVSKLQEANTVIASQAEMIHQLENQVFALSVVEEPSMIENFSNKTIESFQNAKSGAFKYWDNFGKEEASVASVTKSAKDTTAQTLELASKTWEDKVLPSLSFLNRE